MVRARRVERIGRYGAIGLPTEDQIDTEGLENATIAAIDRDLLAALRGACFETTAPLNAWPERIAMTMSSMPRGAGRL